MSMDSTLSLLAFLGMSALAASAGGIFRPGAWYEALRKPSWRPPNRLFGPVWAVLYAMIAVSGWLIYEEFGWEFAQVPLTVFVIQLLLNWLWSAIFFGLRRPGLAFLEIIALWLSIVALIYLFYPIREAAAWLLAPYLLWVSFAAALNFAIWRLNGGAPRVPA